MQDAWVPLKWCHQRKWTELNSGLILFAVTYVWIDGCLAEVVKINSAWQKITTSQTALPQNSGGGKQPFLSLLCLTTDVMLLLFPQELGWICTVQRRKMGRIRCRVLKLSLYFLFSPPAPRPWLPGSHNLPQFGGTGPLLPDRILIFTSLLLLRKSILQWDKAFIPTVECLFAMHGKLRDLFAELESLRYTLNIITRTHKYIYTTLSGSWHHKSYFLDCENKCFRK